MSSEQSESTVENQIDAIIVDYITEAAKIAKKYNVSNAESMCIVNFLELCKIHSHLGEHKQ
jgi:hypothetical protein